MKRLVAIVILVATICLGAKASTILDVQGTVYTVDTLFYNQVGPGTMQTSLLLKSGTKKLRVFYLTFDMTNPLLKLRSVVATDHLAGNETVSNMAQRKSKPGSRYFAGINADFFFLSGTTARGASKVGTPEGSAVVDGEIYRARNSSTSYYKHFIVDKDDNLYINPFFFGGSIVGPRGLSATLGGVNVRANETNASNRNKVTIYNDFYYGSTDEVGTGSEVEAMLAEGEKFETARPFKMVISSDLNTDGDMTIPNGRYVIHGHGTASTKFVKKLQKGDTVTVTPSWTFNGVSVEPEQIISGKPKILEDGVTLNTASEWEVALDPHPRSAIGYSDNGDKVYCLVVDGRSLLSDGVNTLQLADIMRFAGATEAMNIDGGGSSALYTSALGVRNVPSDGFERADGSAIFCVSSAPDDDEIAEIRFLDFALIAPKFGLYTPKFYGYNKYGMLINTDVEGVELSCDETFGTIQNGDTFYATGDGTGLLTANYNGTTVSMPLTIVGSVDGISITNDSIINDALRDYKIDVQSKIGDTQMPIESKALTWSCSDETVVQIDKSEGILRGLKNGEAIVIGKIGAVSDTMKVVVQMPEAREMHIDPNLDISTWKITQSGGKIVEAVGHGNGFTYTYTGASSRNPKIVFAKDFILWSLPDTIRVRLNPGEAPLKNVVFGTRANGSNITYTTVTPQSIEPNTDMIVDLPTSLWTDADFMGNYPIKMQNIQLNMGTSITDQQYTIKVNDITTVYRLMPPDEPKPLMGDLNGDNVIDVKDVTALIGYILGDTPDWFVFDNANVNGEGDVDVQDVTALITKVLE